MEMSPQAHGQKAGRYRKKKLASDLQIMDRGEKKLEKRWKNKKERKK